MSKVLCVGELLLRLSPQLGGEWIRQASMPVFIGGAELNVATALARWEVPAAYCTALPDNYLSKEILSYLEQKSLDTTRIRFSGNRLGTYYMPQGADLKSAGVIYDRAYSSFWELEPGQMDWDAVLQDVSWFHFTAISPALNGNVAEVCLDGARAAAAKGITVSLDLNFRSKLWQWGKDPVDVMPALAAECDVIMGNIWAANTMLGTVIDEAIHDNSSREKYLAHAKLTSQQIMERFSKCKAVANTFRFDRGEELEYYTALFTAEELYHSPVYHARQVVDKAGSGDCFMAGLIYGMYHHLSPQEIVDFAATAAFGKLQEKGDTTNQDVSTIYQNMKKDFTQVDAGA